jgi:hypothetical protein
VRIRNCKHSTYTCQLFASGAKGQRFESSRAYQNFPAKSLKPKAARRFARLTPPFYYSEERQQKPFHCSACGGFNDILGKFGYCTVCGTRNDLEEFQAARKLPSPTQ